MKQLKQSQPKPITRREFIQFSAAALALQFLPRWSFALPQNQDPQQWMDSSPIAFLKKNETSSFDFNGDDITRSHDLLWNIQAHFAKKGGRPEPTENTDVVIVGGGISGLMSAYLLKDKNFILLEQDQRFGGNSKAENFEGSEFSIGAAYICQPEVGSTIDQLLEDLDLKKTMRPEQSDETSVFYQDKVARSFWQGSTDTEARSEFLKIHAELRRILDEEYPDFPESESQMDYQKVLELDQMTFADWLKSHFGEVHPHVLEYFQLYGWSSFGGSIDELSAAQMLNFITAETDTILAFPGGNAAIAQKIYEKIIGLKKPSQIQSRSIVLDVRTVGDFVEVTYENAQGELKTIQSKTCIFAAPKMIAPYVFPTLPKEQLAAIKKISYRGYIASNIIIKKPFQSPSFELYCLRGEVPEAPRAMNQGDRHFTDICFGTWAQKDQVNYGVLTLYKAFPFDGARQFLFSPQAHEKHKSRMLAQAEPILKSLNLVPEDILGTRLTRWGHSLPLAKVGLIASGVLQIASQDYDNKIFFANQDNWASPCFEASIGEAERAVEKVLQRI